MKEKKDMKKKNGKTRKTTVQRMREVMQKYNAGMPWRMMQAHFEAEWSLKEAPVKRILRKVREAIEADIPKSVEGKRNELWSMLQKVFDAAFTESSLDTCVRAAAVMKDLCSGGTEGAPGTLQVIATIEQMRWSFDQMNAAKNAEVKK